MTNTLNKKPFGYQTLELAFWNNRLRNFTQIYKQLRNERIRSMALILEATDSAYFPCFSTMFKNVVTGMNYPNRSKYKNHLETYFHFTNTQKNQYKLLCHKFFAFDNNISYTLCLFCNCNKFSFHCFFIPYKNL